MLRLSLNIQYIDKWRKILENNSKKICPYSRRLSSIMSLMIVISALVVTLMILQKIIFFFGKKNCPTRHNFFISK